MTELRPYRPGDEAGIRDLFAACHGRPLAEDLRAWRYSPPGGRPAVIEVGVDAGRVVAHLAAIPVVLRRGGRSLPAALWADLMVAPDHRNLDLFLDMAESNRRRCAAAGLSLLFAFPNDKSYPVLKRMLGWTAVEEIDALEAPLAALSVPAAPAAVRVQPAAAFGPEHDALWERLRPAGAWAAERGAERLDWRYARRPQGRYAAWDARAADGRLLGWAATKVFAGPDGTVGDVLDLWAEPGADAALWAAALARFRAEGAATVSAWALRGTAPFARYEAWGLAPRGPRTHFAARWTADDAPEPLPGRGTDWIVAKGDSDVF